MQYQIISTLEPLESQFVKYNFEINVSISIAMTMYALTAPGRLQREYGILCVDVFPDVIWKEL